MSLFTTSSAASGLLFLLIVAPPLVLEAQGIFEGRVSQLAGRRAGVALTAGGRAPAVGDSARLFDASLPGEAPIPVQGRWRVVEVTSGIAWLEPEGAAVDAAPGYLARIHLSAPGTRLPPSAPPSVPSPPGLPSGREETPATGGSTSPIPALPATRELRSRTVRNLGELDLPRDARQLAGDSPEWSWSVGRQSIRIESWPKRAHTQDLPAMMAYLWPRHTEEVLGVGTPVIRWENRALEGKPECLSSATHLDRVKFFVLVICPGGDPREWLVFEGNTTQSEPEEATVFAIVRSYRPR